MTLADVADLLDVVVNSWRLITTVVGSGVFLFFLSRWLDRPRVRIKIRNPGFFGDDKSLFFEVANGGSRAIALHPEVRLRATRIPMRRRLLWYPGFIERLLSEKTIARLRLGVPVQKLGEEITIHYDVDPTCGLRLEPHADSRMIKANPRENLSSEFGWGMAFRRYEFRFEGRRRRHTLHMFVSDKRVFSCWFWFRRLLAEIFTVIPKSSGPHDINEWQESRRSRG